MALTHELDRKDSPVRRWFDERLPNAKPISKEWNEKVRPVPIARPETDERIPGTVGTAFDYRLRYHLAVTPLEELVAGIGMRLLDPTHQSTRPTRGAPDEFLRLAGHPPTAAEPIRGLLGAFGERLERTLVELAPVGRTLDDKTEETLCRYCYILGLFEELFRAGLGINSPLYALEPKSTVDDLLALPPQLWVDDLRALSRIFAAHRDEVVTGEFVLNPTLSGSGEIGGADADLIAGGCLIDVKTTVDPKFTRTRLLYQLLGYALLDYDDVYGIDTVGVYLSRQGLFVGWPLTTLIATLSEGKAPALPELRASFREAVLARRLHRPRRLTGLRRIANRSGRSTDRRQP